MVAGEEAKVEPLAEFGPSFGFELGFGVGGDYTTGVREGTEGPEGELGDGCGLGDAVARGDRFLNGGVNVDKTIADSIHKVRGPLFWTFGVFKNCAGLAPWESTHHKGEWVALDGCQPCEEFVVVHIKVSFINIQGRCKENSLHYGSP